MTGQARAAAWRTGSGEGLVTMRSAPTAIVSRPSPARARSRLSTRSANAPASRHARARLSARARSRATVVSWAAAALAQATAINTNAQARLHIDEHPATGEHGQWARPVENHDLEHVDEIEWDVGEARQHLDQHEGGHGAEDDAGRPRRPRRYGEE